MARAKLAAVEADPAMDVDRGEAEGEAKVRKGRGPARPLIVHVMVTANGVRAYASAERAAGDANLIAEVTGEAAPAITEAVVIR